MTDGCSDAARSTEKEKRYQEELARFEKMVLDKKHPHHDYAVKRLNYHKDLMALLDELAEARKTIPELESKISYLEQLNHDLDYCAEESDKKAKSLEKECTWLWKQLQRLGYEDDMSEADVMNYVDTLHSFEDKLIDIEESLESLVKTWRNQPIGEQHLAFKCADEVEAIINKCPCWKASRIECAKCQDVPSWYFDNHYPSKEDEGK